MQFKPDFLLPIKHIRDNKRDFARGFAVIFLIETILVVIFLLPANIKNYFVLNRFHPTLASIYLMNFTHESVIHLAGNLAGFTIISFYVLLILSMMRKTSYFYKLLAVNLLLIPFILSLSWLYYQNNVIKSQLQNTQGFSGINASLSGSLIFVFFFYIVETIKIKLNFNYAFYSFLFFMVFYLCLIYFKYLKQLTPFVVTSILSVSFYLLMIRSMKVLNEKLSKKLAVFFVSMPFVIIALLSNTFFPVNVGNVDILVHYFGFILGIVVIFILKV
jgi:hypothetical protein